MCSRPPALRLASSSPSRSGGSMARSTTARSLIARTGANTSATSNARPRADVNQNDLQGSGTGAFGCPVHLVRRPQLRAFVDRPQRSRVQVDRSREGTRGRTSSAGSSFPIGPPHPSRDEHIRGGAPGAHTSALALAVVRRETGVDNGTESRRGPRDAAPSACSGGAVHPAREQAGRHGRRRANTLAGKLGGDLGGWEHRHRRRAGRFP